MVSIKKNFPQHNRVRTAGVPYKKPFKHGPGSSFNHVMFNASQIPDNIYTDFNNPTPPISYSSGHSKAMGGGGGSGNGHNHSTGNATTTIATTSQSASGGGSGNVTSAAASAAASSGKKKAIKQKQKGKQQTQQNSPQYNGNGGSANGGNGGNGAWNKPKNGYNHHHQSMGYSPGNSSGSGMGSHNRKFVGTGPPRSMTMGRGRRMMMPPLGPHGLRGGPMPPIPPMPPHGFQPPPPPPPQMIPPPISRMARGPPMSGGPPHPHLHPPPPPYLRRSGRNGGPPMPPMMPPMMPPIIMPPRMPRAMPPGMPPYGGAAAAVAAGKIKKQKIAKKIVRGKSTIKTLKNLVNQYPLDKPWVTSQIRDEHDKKVDMENRLKGNKDDDLFAQFKVQRDKFVSLYEAAREEYLKQEAAAVKAKDAKDTKTSTCKTNADADDKMQ